MDELAMYNNIGNHMCENNKYDKLEYINSIRDKKYRTTSTNCKNFELKNCIPIYSDDNITFCDSFVCGIEI